LGEWWGRHGGLGADAAVWRKPGNTSAA
jgi:hypothetical protein